jgi:hypothetical protein
LFSFDRSICELIGRTLLNNLVDAEEKWKETSPQWKQKLRQYELWQSRAKQREQDQARSRKQVKTEDGADARDMPQASWEASFDPDDPLPEFSFAGTSKYSREELDDDVMELVGV